MSVAEAAVTQGELYYVHNDHLGTPQVMTDRGGSIVWHATYDPFGMADVDTASTIEMNVRFPGQYFDIETGLQYNYFRYYDPISGRFITSDPIGLDGGINLFAYVKNNPNKYFDPYGLLLFEWYGNWGGPGHVNGQTYRPQGKGRNGRNRSVSTGWRESDNFPRAGDAGYIHPIDARDEAYYVHDSCISDCYHYHKKQCKEMDNLGDCISMCDIDLSNNPNIPWYEQRLFRLYSLIR
jgi:RHS repeat-associated protein